MYMYIHRIPVPACTCVYYTIHTPYLHVHVGPYVCTCVYYTYTVAACTCMSICAHYTYTVATCTCSTLCM